MRYINGAFLVTGKDIEARKFESRREAKDWCVTHYSGSPIYEIGGGLIQTNNPGHATERSSAPKGSSHNQNKRARRVGWDF